MGEPTIENYKLLAGAMVGQIAEDLGCCYYIEKNLKNNVVAKYGVNKIIKTFETERKQFDALYFQRMRHLKNCLRSFSDEQALREVNLDIIRLKRERKYHKLKTDKNIARAVIKHYTDHEIDNTIAVMEDTRFDIISNVGKDGVIYGAKRAVEKGTFNTSRQNPIYFMNLLDFRATMNYAAKEVAYGRQTYQHAIK